MIVTATNRRFPIRTTERDKLESKIESLGHWQVVAMILRMEFVQKWSPLKRKVVDDWVQVRMSVHVPAFACV